MKIIILGAGAFGTALAVNAASTLDGGVQRNQVSLWARDAALVQQLHDGLSAAAADPDVRCVVLGHTGGTFCAGADLSEAAGRDPGDLTTIDDPSTLEQIRNALAS